MIRFLCWWLYVNNEDICCNNKCVKGWFIGQMRVFTPSSWRIPGEVREITWLTLYLEDSLDYLLFFNQKCSNDSMLIRSAQLLLVTCFWCKWHNEILHKLLRRSLFSLRRCGIQKVSSEESTQKLDQRYPKFVQNKTNIWLIEYLHRASRIYNLHI
jgi:hypothetical protein